MTTISVTIVVKMGRLTLKLDRFMGYSPLPANDSGLALLVRDRDRGAIVYQLLP
jgi:hypothetical protein